MGHKFITEPGSERDLFDVDLRAIVLKRPWRTVADWDHQATREVFGTERPGSCRPDKAPPPRSDGRTFDEIAQERHQEASGIARCRREIAAIEGQIRAGHPDLQGLCLALADWSGELRLLKDTRGLATGPR